MPGVEEEEADDEPEDVGREEGDDEREEEIICEEIFDMEAAWMCGDVDLDGTDGYVDRGEHQVGHDADPEVYHRHVEFV